MRTVLGCLVAFMFSVALAQAERPQYSLQIERQPLIDTLRELSRQTGLQMVALFGQQAMQQSRVVGPIRGQYTAEEALVELLEHSDLVFHRVNKNTFVVTVRSSAAPMSSY